MHPGVCLVTSPLEGIDKGTQDCFTRDKCPCFGYWKTEDLGPPFYNKEWCLPTSTKYSPSSFFDSQKAITSLLPPSTSSAWKLILNDGTKPPIQATRVSKKKDPWHYLNLNTKDIIFRTCFVQHGSIEVPLVWKSGDQSLLMASLLLACRWLLLTSLFSFLK